VENVGDGSRRSRRKMEKIRNEGFSKKSLFLREKREPKFVTCED